MLNYKNKVEAVCERLREDIVSVTYKTGDWLISGEDTIYEKL